MASVLGLHAAHADTFYGERGDTGVPSAPSGSVWVDSRMQSGIGIGVQVGGGVTGFVDSSTRGAIGNGVGGLWQLRAAFGTHVPLALEIGYMGSATPIETEFGRANALMLGTTVEAALRYTMMPQYPWSPYAFAGAGWQRYTIDDRAFQLSDIGIGHRDDLLVLPLGVGFTYRVGAFVTDVRGTFRAARGADLVLENPELSLATGAGSYAPMHTWDASLNLGYEF